MGFGGAFHNGSVPGVSLRLTGGSAGRTENGVGLGRPRVENRSDPPTKCAPFSVQACVGGTEGPCAPAAPGAEAQCANSGVGASTPWPGEDPVEPPLVVSEAPPSPERGHSEDVSTCTPRTQVWWAIRHGVPSCGLAKLQMLCAVGDGGRSRSGRPKISASPSAEREMLPCMGTGALQGPVWADRL